MHTPADQYRRKHGLLGGKVLSPMSLKAMTTLGQGDYELGLEVNNADGVKVIEHNRVQPCNK